MAFGISAATYAMVGAGVALYSAATAKAPSIPTPAAPIAPPQASVAPDAYSSLKAMSGTGQAGGAPGVASTFLTGAGGVDQGNLLLGKNTLLGG